MACRAAAALPVGLFYGGFPPRRNLPVPLSECAVGRHPPGGGYSTRRFFRRSSRWKRGGLFQTSTARPNLGGTCQDRFISRPQSASARRLFLCCRAGAWEEPMAGSTRAASTICSGTATVPRIGRFLGHATVSHDWPWWHRQLFTLWNKCWRTDRAEPGPGNLGIRDIVFSLASYECSASSC